SENCLSGEYYYNLNLLNGINYQSIGVNDNRMNAGLNIDGIYNVRINVNDKSLGYINIAFKNINNHFSPELSDELVEKIGFNRDVLETLKKNKIQDLFGLTNFFPDIIFNTFIGKGKLVIRVPESYLRYKDETFPEEWDYGMTSLYSSYDFSGYHNNDEVNSKSKFQYLNLYNGLNIGKWQLRNKTYYTRENSKSRIYSDKTWLSRDFGAINSRVTVGQTMSSGFFNPTFRIDGIKFESIPDMRPSFLNSYMPDIQGNALTNATVKIYQGDNLVYQTFVNPGPFTLTDIPTTGNSDLKVQIIEENGIVHEDFVPVSSSDTLRRKNVLDYSISAGKQNVKRAELMKNHVITAEMLYGVTSISTLLTGLTYSEDYRSASLGGGFNLGNTGVSSIIGTNSQNSFYKKEGNAIELRHYKKISTLSTQIDFRHKYFSGNYSEIDDELTLSSLRNKKSLTSLSINQPTDHYGNFRLSVYLSRFQQKNHNKTTYSINWNKYLYGVFYTLSTSRSEYMNDNYRNENIFSINLSIPFDSESKNYIPSSVGYNYTSGKNYNSNTFSVDKNLFHNKAKLNATHSENKFSKDINTSNMISGTYISDYTKLYAGFANQSNGYKQKSWKVSGSLIAHPYGITFSPYSISERGASTIVSIPGASGVSLINNISSTDFFGNVFVNNLHPYKKNNININLRNLPSNIEVQNIESKLIPADGAITYTEFSATVGNRAILKLLFNGKSLPFGSTVTEDPLAFANASGIIYITGLENSQRLHIKMPDGNKCSMIFDISESKNRNEIYFYNGICN
ncbi:fimbrial biogenesis outer membrane usher protein, partial [Salmonella enterica]|nr:fimbrial biogenesis outer membrane usher protein [Salmonella enterica]